jgi:dipeptidyl aminopeptidase/acylaminoacyl peptidase
MAFSARFSFAALMLAAPVVASAQKKTLTQADWDRWRSIQGATISADGKWVAYTLSPQVGDGEFVVRSTTGATEYRVNVGYIGRPNNNPGGARGAGAGGGGGGGGGGRGGGTIAGQGGPFSPDGKYAFVSTQATKAVVDSIARAQAAARGGGQGARAGGGGAGRAGAAPGGGAASANTAPQAVLKMISLADGKVSDLPTWRSYRIPRFSTKWLMYTTSEPDSAAGAAGAAAEGGRGGGRAGGGAAGGRGGRGGGGGGGGTVAGAYRRTFGNPIILRNMDTGADETIADVVAYQWDDSAKVLAYTIGSRADSTKDGVYLRDMATGQVRVVTSGPGNYRNFAFDRTQTQFVFSTDKAEFGRDSAQSVIYIGSVKTGSATPAVDKSMVPAGLRLGGNGSASFNRNATALTLSLAAPTIEAVPEDSLVGKSNFDLWHWKDPQLMPTQKLQVGQARNRSYQAVYHIASKKLVRLSTDSFPSVTLSDDATRGIASTGVPYNVERMWVNDGSDLYVVDPVTASRKLLRKKVSGASQISVGGRYAVFFDRGAWYSYDFATGKETNFTGNIKGVRFDQETFSTPGAAGAWGVAGWTRDDSSVLLYDRFDIWQVDPTGVRAPVVVTDSLGRRENITLRIINLAADQADERYVDTSKPLWLSAFDEDNKQSGFYRDQIGVRRAPEKVVMADVRYGAPQKARNADVWMVTKSTFVDFPNIHVGPSLTQLTKISDANPWQKEYNWGTAELVTWTSMDGVPLQGILYKPESFDPTKKYPMISYFYEDLSDGLHGYIAPTGRNVINPTHYVSNGYMIFEPDIHYELGHPGPSALKSIVPGVMKLLERGYIDPKGLGLQGQSWGGYQAAYIITQTQMFSGAMAGAPVANMTSAYGGIRLGSGIARAVQYEDGQSRIGASIWDQPDLYILNSPLFHLNRVTTPLFMMHNDLDDAVPFSQGIELFVGLRRLGKEVYLINYNNDVHNPASRANQKDVAMRMEQFFDATLKKKPAPEWMVKGIPAVEKGRDQITPAGAQQQGRGGRGGGR